MKNHFVLFLSLFLLNISCSDEGPDMPCVPLCEDLEIIGLDYSAPTEISWEDVYQDHNGDCNLGKFELELIDKNGLVIENNIVNTEHANDTLTAIIKEKGGENNCSGRIIIRDFEKEVLVFEKNKITCINCHQFAYFIEADGDYIFIADRNTIWIVKGRGEEIQLVQSIEGFKQGSIFSMIAKEGKMAFSTTTGDEEGQVYIYEESNGSWEFQQQLTGPVNGSHFGSAIDFQGSNLVVGASAIWGGAEPSIHIYNNESGDYTKVAEFTVTNPPSWHEFGGVVAIQGKYVLAGSFGIPLHVYELENGMWKFNRTEDYSAFRLRHDGNKFMMATEQPWDIIGFELRDDGSFDIQDVSTSFYEGEIAGHGEVIDINNDLAFLVVQTPNECYSFRYEGSNWIHDRAFYPDEGETCAYAGVEITDDYYILGGDEFENPYPMGYVYLIER